MRTDVIGRLSGLFSSPLRRPEANAPLTIEVDHGGERFGVEVRRSPTARRLILRVRGATRDAVLTIPRRTSIADARSFAERQASWIGARLRRLPEPVPFEAGEIVPVRGVPTRIVSDPGQRGTAWIAPPGSPGSLQQLHVAGDPRHLPRRVVDFLRREARRDLERAVEVAAARIGRPAPPITLRDTSSRWGSCTATGRLNFSWRLILAPPVVLDYLAAHEVSHLRHMNHGPKFWALCRQLNPDTDRAEAWLNAHGAGLHRYRLKSAADQTRTNVR